jgi:hypothetical protein
MQETRIAPRRRILKARTIESGGGIECHVKNLSDAGAAPALRPGQLHTGRAERSVEAVLPRRLAEGEANRHRVRVKQFTWSTASRQLGFHGKIGKQAVAEIGMTNLLNPMSIV